MTTFQITWLGGAGVLINTPESSVLIDPFVTRPSFIKVAFGIPFQINHQKINQVLSLLELKKNRAVITSHSHYDHACDAPYFAKEIGATFLGSSSSLHLTKAAGLVSDQTKNTDQLATPFLLGDQKITFIKSQHGPALFGKIPYAGKIEKDLAPPLRASQYRDGGTSIIEINSNETSILHVGSAGYLPSQLSSKKCDIVLLTVVGIQNVDEYIENLVSNRNAKIIIPIHFDNMFKPLVEKIPHMPFLNLEIIIKKLEMTGAKIILPRPLIPISF